jgi:hypothetical protein
MSRDIPPPTQGLKRDPSLILLSRDHHGALVQSLGLRRGARGPSRAAAEDYLAYFRDELDGHMADEERFVLPLAEPLDPQGTKRVRGEHEELRALTVALANALRDGGDLAPLMEAIAALLDDHVRFEERAFFMSLQAKLSPEGLLELGRALDAHRASRGSAPSCSLPPKV